MQYRLVNSRQFRDSDTTSIRLPAPIFRRRGSAVYANLHGIRFWNDAPLVPGVCSLLWFRLCSHPSVIPSWKPPRSARSLSRSGHLDEDNTGPGPELEPNCSRCSRWAHLRHESRGFPGDASNRGPDVFANATPHKSDPRAARSAP